MTSGARGVARRTATRCLGAMMLAAAAFTCVADALADAAPERWRSGTHYALNGAVAAALLGGSALTGFLRQEVEAGNDTVWFPGDAGLRGKCSPEAARLSDATLSLAVTLPIGMELGRGLDARFVNAEIVYTQALLTTQLLTSAVKVIFRRPRPFSYRADRDCAFWVEESDANLSFFSGHASGSFAAAFAGSSLMSEHGLDGRTRAAIWGAELALAGATANLRARAGKHYYSDIVVGALVGAGIGFAVPVLHGGEGELRGTDLLAGSAGLVVGVASSQLVALGAEATDADAVRHVRLTPLPLAGAYGLLALGSW